MEALQIIFAIFSGISLVFAVLSLSVFFLYRDQKLYFLFGTFSLFSGLYFLLFSVSEAGIKGLGWAIILSAALYYAIFPWFLFRFVNKKGTWVLWVVSSVFLLAFLAYVLILKKETYPMWQIIAHLGLLGLIAIALVSCIHYQNQPARNREYFYVLCGLFIILGLEEIIRTYSGLELLSAYVKGIQPLDIYPILFTFSMGIRMSNDFIYKKELQVQRIANELNKKKLQLTMIESERLKDEVEFKKKDLMLLGIELNRMTEYEKSIMERMNLLRKKKSIKHSDLDDVIRYSKAQLRIGQNLEHFHSNVEEVNHEFLFNLKSKFPNLTENELHLSSLLRLKLNTKEIATIKNISPDSVKVLRYRLRKKFGLATPTNLADFLQQF